MGDGEEATGEGGQKVERDKAEGEEEGVRLLLTVLPLLLMPPILALLLASP